MSVMTEEQGTVFEQPLFFFRCPNAEKSGGCRWKDQSGTMGILAFRWLKTAGFHDRIT
jgi:hypothetical protein